MDVRPNSPPASTRLLGEILLEEGYLQHDDLVRLVQHQRNLPLNERKPIGRLAVELGYLTEAQLRTTLDVHGKRLSLGELLVARGSISREDLARALERQANEGGLLGELLVSSGCLDEVALAETLAEQADLPYVPLGADDPLEANLARWVNPYYASHHGIVPVGRLGRRLTVGIWHPTSIGCAAELENSTGMLVRFVISTRSQVDARVKALYGITPQPPRGGGPVTQKITLVTRPALMVEGPLAPFGFDSVRAAELDTLLRGGEGDGVFLVSGPGGAQLEEFYLRLWRYGQELDRSNEQGCEGAGEIRDQRTAERIFRTRNAQGVRLGFIASEHSVGALQRLIDLGIHPDRVQGLLLGVLTVCPVRQVCAQCSESYEPHSLVQQEWFGPGGPNAVRSIPAARWRRGRGCKTCVGTGFLGEVVLHELWTPDETERRQIAHRLPMRSVRDHAAERIDTLGRNGLDRAMAGLTTLEELLKRLPVDEVRLVRASLRARGDDASPDPERRAA